MQLWRPGKWHSLVYIPMLPELAIEGRSRIDRQAILD